MWYVFRVEADILNREREKLMKKLIEVEMDGQAAGKQVSELRDLIRKLRSVSDLTTASNSPRQFLLIFSGSKKYCIMIKHFLFFFM